MGGRPHGQGELITKSGVIYRGRFQEGFFDDENGSYEANTYSYKGGFRKGKKNGYGRYEGKKEEVIIEGVWCDDYIEKNEWGND